ncbi:MAG: hypothetical protein HOC93_07900 [Phycisphaerae bacterium]|nr:hypothetical protein [Phycisphaerae bacterium]
MSKSNECSGMSCPAPWLLFGAGAGVIVGVITDNIGLWIGIGAGIGVAFCLLRAKTSTCCSTKQNESNCCNSEKK